MTVVMGIGIGIGMLNIDDRDLMDFHLLIIVDGISESTGVSLGI